MLKRLKPRLKKCSLDKIGINWAKILQSFVPKSYILKGIADPLSKEFSRDRLRGLETDQERQHKNVHYDRSSRAKSNRWDTHDNRCFIWTPGRVILSHLDTLRTVFDMGFDYFNVGPIRMLPGSEMESEQSRKEYGLKTQYRLISGNYGKYDGNPVVEYEESVVASSDMTREETYKLRLIHFFTWVFWNSGLGQPLLRWLLRKILIHWMPYCHWSQNG